MKTRCGFHRVGVCVLLLSGLSVSAVSVDVRPNRQQFFSREDGFTVSCADVQTDEWTVKRTQRDGGRTQTCAEFGWMNGVSCVVSFPVPSSSGVYWCETSSGQQSEQVTITVTDGILILDIPALPVQTGSDVTLRCRSRGGSTVKAEFFKNGRTLTSVAVEQWTIRGDPLSEEDLYSCSVPLVGESPQSSLRVKGSTTTTSGPTPSSSDPGSSDPGSSDPGSPVSIVRLFLHMLVMSPYCVSTVLMMSIYCKRNTGGTAAIAMETGQRRIEDDEYDDVAAGGVTMETRQRRFEDDADVAAAIAIEHDF